MSQDTIDETDERLVRRSQVGDRAAFEQLVRQTARLVYSRIYLDTADRHRSEDLTQETFLIAWKRIGQVTEPSGFRPWLLTVAKTVTADARRRETRKKRAGPKSAESLEASREVSDSRTPTPAQSAERREQRDRMLGVLRELPEQYSLPLTLRYIAGADYDTIGKQLGLTNGSLRGFLNRGMAMLKEMMNDE